MKKSVCLIASIAVVGCALITLAGAQSSPGLVVNYLDPEKYPENTPEVGYLGSIYNVTGECKPGSKLTLSFAGYDPTDLGIENLRICHYAGGKWALLPSTVDRSKQTITAPVTELGIYSITAVPIKDNQAPTIEWLLPAQKALLKGKAEFIVIPDDNVGISEITFYLNNREIAKDYTGMDGSWGAQVDLSCYASGTYSLKAEVEDLAGNIGKATCEVALETDAHAPVVTIESVAWDQKEGGVVVVTGTVEDADGDTGFRIGVDLDGKPLPWIANVNNGKWLMLIEPVLFGPGKHKLAAFAEDEYGNEGQAALTTSLPLSAVSLFCGDMDFGFLGKPVELTAFATGGSTVQYQFEIKTGAKAWKVLRSYAASDKFTWKPSKAGKYTLRVCARGEGGSKVFTCQGSFTVKPAPPKPSKQK